MENKNLKVLGEADAEMFGWKLKCHDVFRWLASVKIVGHDETLKVRREKEVNEAVWDASEEIAGCNEVDDVVEIKPYKLATVVTVPADVKSTFEQLEVKDGKVTPLFNKERYWDYILSKAASQIGSAEERAFISGDGNNKPFGVIRGANGGIMSAKVTQTGDTVTFVEPSDIFDLFYGVDLECREKGVWLMSDAMLAQIKNDQKFNIFSDVTKEKREYSGDYDKIKSKETLLGRPVITSKYMGVNYDNGEQSGTVDVVFGDFSAYKIVQEGNIEVQEVKGWRRDKDITYNIHKTPEIKYAKLETAEGEPEKYYFAIRVGGQLIYPKAVKVNASRYLNTLRKGYYSSF